MLFQSGSEVTVRTDGKIWYQRYDRGIPEEDVKEIV